MRVSAHPLAHPLALGLLVFGLAFQPGAALAHGGAGVAAGFGPGLLHPLGGPDHVLAMVAVGVLAALLGGRARLFVPASFLAMLAVGFGLGVNGVPLPLVETGIALSVIVIGAAAAWGGALPSAAAVTIVGFFAVFHGHAHGTEMPAAAAGLAYALGFMAATALLHLAGMALAQGALRLAGQPVARLAGGLVALGGAGLLAGWL